LLRVGSILRLHNVAHRIAKSGRGEWIRTTDPSVPNRVLYQAEPRPDKAREVREKCPQRPGTAWTEPALYRKTRFPHNELGPDRVRGVTRPNHQTARAQSRPKPMPRITQTAGVRERGAPRRAAGASPVALLLAPSTTWGCSRTGPAVDSDSREPMGWTNEKTNQ
jgi:hypothetical protein